MLTAIACNARVLTAYESQRRMTRNFLDGARKKRMSYTPSGLFVAWKDLGAASQVYVLTLLGLVVTVNRLSCGCHRSFADT